MITKGKIFRQDIRILECRTCYENNDDQVIKAPRIFSEDLSRNWNALCLLIYL